MALASLCLPANAEPTTPVITSVMTNIVAPVTGTYEPDQRIDAVAGHGVAFDTTGSECWPPHNAKIGWKHTVSWDQDSPAEDTWEGSTGQSGPNCTKYTEPTPISEGRWYIPSTEGPVYYTFTATTKAKVSSHTYPPMHPDAPGPEIWAEGWTDGTPAGSQLNIPAP